MLHSPRLAPHGHHPVHPPTGRIFWTGLGWFLLWLLALAAALITDQAYRV